MPENQLITLIWDEIKSTRMDVKAVREELGGLKDMLHFQRGKLVAYAAVGSTVLSFICSLLYTCLRGVTG